MLALLNFTHFVATSGYVAIFILSVLQSCCVPTSSELTLGFAGVLAAEGKLSLPGAILAGASGELVGAYIAWAVGYFGGRAFVERYGRFVLMAPEDLDRAQAWYDRHQRFGVFGSRLLPVVRNFVAVPAGVAEVPLVRFGVLTALGSVIWDGAMALIGYGIGGSWRSVMKGFSDAGYVLLLLVVLAVVVVIRHRWKAYQRSVRRGRARPSAGAARVPAGGARPPQARRPSSAPAPGSLAEKLEQSQARAATQRAGSRPAGPPPQARPADRHGRTDRF